MKYQAKRRVWLELNHFGTLADETNTKPRESTMQRDILFLLKEKFEDGPGQPYYCPQCAEINGVLAYFPELRHRLDVRYVDFPRPRQAIIELIGEASQGCPVLVLGEKPEAELMELTSGNLNGRYFISGPGEIARYWARVHNISRPH